MTRAIIYHTMPNEVGKYSTPIGFTKVLDEFGVFDMHIVVDSFDLYKSLYDMTDRRKPVKSIVVNSLNEALSYCQHMKKIFLNRHGTTKLENFEHPKDDVVYVIGEDHSERVVDNVDKADILVRIPTKGSWVWANQALSILCYDIILKRGLK